MAFKALQNLTTAALIVLSPPFPYTSARRTSLIISQTHLLLSNPCAFPQMISLTRKTFSSLSHCSRPSSIAISSNKISLIFLTRNIPSLLYTPKARCQIYCSHLILHYCIGTTPLYSFHHSNNTLLILSP